MVHGLCGNSPEVSAAIRALAFYLWPRVLSSGLWPDESFIAAKSNGVSVPHLVHSASGFSSSSVMILKELLPHFGQLSCMALSPASLRK